MRRDHGFLLLALYVGLIVAGVLLGEWLRELASIEVQPAGQAPLNFTLVSATAIYVVAAAMPFVPGAGIGWALVVALGPELLLLVCPSLVAALMLSYTAGRFVPPRLTAALFQSLGLQRARDLVLQIAPLGTDERLELLIAAAPPRVVPFLLRHRYVALAVVFNLPGNTILGGGGGLALAAGMSRVYRWPGYLLTVAVAISPVPLLILATGTVLSG